MIRRVVRGVVRRAFRWSLFAMALGLGGLLAYGVVGESVQGSGVAMTEERPIGAVTEVTISGIGNLELVRGDVPSVRITADDNILSLLETRNHNGKLMLRSLSGFQFNPVTPITYVVTAPNVESVNVSGAGNIKSAGMDGDSLTVKLSGACNANLQNIRCKALTVTLSGAGNATLAGAVETVTLKISGAGEIDARALKATSANAQISGAGIASMWATDELKVKVSGAGTVQYRGNPHIDQRISGAGHVRKIEQ